MVRKKKQNSNKTRILARYGVITLLFLLLSVVIVVKLFNTTEDANKVTTRISTMTVALTSKTTGVGNIAIADENAPAEYFNLQGVRVANPVSGGLYIVRQGGKVSKTIVK